MDTSNAEPGSSFTGVSTADPRLANRRANLQISRTAGSSSSISPNTPQDATQAATQDVLPNASNASSFQNSSAGTSNTDPMKNLQDLMNLNYHVNVKEAEMKKAGQQVANAELSLENAKKSKTPYQATIEMLQSAHNKALEKYAQAHKAYKTKQADYQSLSNSFSMPWPTFPPPPSASPTGLASPAESQRITRIESDLRAQNDKIKENSQTLSQDRQQLTTFESSLREAHTSINSHSLQLADMNKNIDRMGDWINSAKDGNVFSTMESHQQIHDLLRAQRRGIDQLETSVSQLQSENSSRSATTLAIERVTNTVQPDISTLKTAVRSLESRFNNLTSEEIVQSMVNAMNRMYPNIEQFAQKLNEMQQQIDRFSSTPQGQDSLAISDLQGNIQDCMSSLAELQSSQRDNFSGVTDDLRKMNQENTKMRKDMHELQNKTSSRQTAFESFGEHYQEDITQSKQDLDSIKLRLDDLGTRTTSIEGVLDKFIGLSGLPSAAQIEDQLQSALREILTTKESAFREILTIRDKCARGLERIDLKVDELLKVAYQLHLPNSLSVRIREDTGSSPALLKGPDVPNGTGKRKRLPAGESEEARSTTPRTQSSEERKNRTNPGI